MVEKVGSLEELVKLTKCQVSINFNQFKIHDKGLETILKEVTKRKLQIKSLSLLIDQLESSGLNSLLKIIDSSDIDTLYLKIHNFSEKQIADLLEAITHNKSISTLYLISNNINDRHFPALKLLSEQHSFKSFWLESDSITNLISKVYIALLKTQKLLISLTLIGEKLGDPVAYTIANFLKTDSTVANLHLQLSQMTPKCAEKVVAMLQSNLEIGYLNILSKNFDQNTQNEIDKKIRKLTDRNTVVSPMQIAKEKRKVPTLLHFCFYSMLQYAKKNPNEASEISMKLDQIMPNFKI